MPLTSPDDREELFSLSSQLNATSLLDVASDILSVRGHRQIRITDGPGDGACDVHSVSSSGEVHITQCKYHANIDQSITSRELSELPVALHKFGRTDGLFLTNARISPQAKREYLNDYREFTMDFLDGLSLVRELRQDQFLRARWLDGKPINWKFNVRFPVLLRAHLEDRPLLVARACDSTTATIENLIGRSFNGTAVTLAVDFADEEDFTSYREPNQLTQEEGLYSRLRCTMVTLKGCSSLSEMEYFPDIIANAISSSVKNQLDNFSIIIGQPSIASLFGDDGVITRIQRYRAVTFTYTREHHLSEADFFSLESDHWSTSTDARVTEADAIRLYNEDLDVFIEVNHISRKSKSDERHDRAVRLYMLEKWNLSVFCIFREPHIADFHGLPEPSYQVELPWAKAWLLGWPHQALLGALVSLPSSEPDVPRIESFNDDDECNRLASIREELEKIDGTFMLQPGQARHLFASASRDIFEEEGEIIFRTAELTLGTNSGLPSPALPSRRLFTASFYVSNCSEQRILNGLNSISTDSVRCVEPHFENDNGGLWVHLKLALKDVDDASTSLLLNDIYHWLALLVAEIGREDEIALDTRERWQHLTGVRLGISWDESRKLYASPYFDDVVPPNQKHEKLRKAIRSSGVL